MPVNSQEDLEQSFWKKSISGRQLISILRISDRISSIHDVTYENSQARERTQILMDLANKKGGLVIGTGDMSELALGWATYNGDHMSMYGVNCSVPKTLVRHLVRYYADTCGDERLSARFCWMCWIHRSARSFCRRRTERFPRRQKIW